MSEHKERRKYTREFKVEAVKLYETSGKSMSSIEQELGITPYLLAKWVEQFRESGQEAFPGKGKLEKGMRNCAVCDARMKSCGRSAIS